MQNVNKYFAITMALILGTIAAIVTSGCQPPNNPGKRATASPTTQGSKAVPTKPVPAAVEEPKKEEPKVEQPKEEAKPDVPKPDAPKADAPAVDAPKSDPPKPDAPPAEAPKTDPPKPEAPKSDPPADAPKADAPKPDAPTTETPKADQSKTETPKIELAKVTVPAAPSGDIPSLDKTANAPVKPGDWGQWGGTSYRNNTPIVNSVPEEWDPADFDRKTGEWKREKSKNIKWVSALGSQTYGNPVVASGKVYVGTNNSGGYVKRYPSEVDLGVLLCFNEADGKFLWQHSSEKLPTGRVHDWPLQGICCSPYAEGKRVWFVTSRGEVRCLDAEGFHDNVDDGPLKNDLGRLFDVMRNEDPKLDQIPGMIADLKANKIDDTLRSKFAAAGSELPAEAAVKVDDEGKKWTVTATIGGAAREFKLMLQGPRLSAFKVVSVADKDEADVIWVYDMMKELGVSQHNMCSCSITALDDILFVCTSNGLDEAHISVPAPNAPSFIAMDKNTGKVLWTDKSPGENIHHGQWSSPTVAKLGGVPQVLFGGGDGWLYSFRADAGKDGKPELLWKADLNPKEAKLILGGRGRRNDIIGTPVVYDGLVYVAMGQDPEHGEGDGDLYCIDPNKRGDVSEMLAVKRDTGEIIPYRRLQAVIPEDGEVAKPNPNSAIIWHYQGTAPNGGNGTIPFDKRMHRTCSTVTIKNDLLFIADFSGLFHCLNAKTGKMNWTYDMLAAMWGSALIAGDKVIIGDEDGDVVVFDLKAQKHEPIFEVNMLSSIYSTPVMANDVLYIANKDHLFAIQVPLKLASDKK